MASSGRWSSQFIAPRYCIRERTATCGARRNQKAFAALRTNTKRIGLDIAC
jgi:hypothetical protein